MFYKNQTTEVDDPNTLAVEACFELYCALVNIYWKCKPAYFKLPPWRSMPSTSFVIEAFNSRWMIKHIFNQRL